MVSLSPLSLLILGSGLVLLPGHLARARRDFPFGAWPSCADQATCSGCEFVSHSSGAHAETLEVPSDRPAARASQAPTLLNVGISGVGV